MEEETTEHLFFHCSWVRCVWFGCALTIRIDCIQKYNFFAWWIQLFEPENLFIKFGRILICWNLWLIWKARDSLAFEHGQPDPRDIIDKAYFYAKECWDAQGLNKPNAIELEEGSISSRWMALSVDCMKVNCDGVFSKDINNAAVEIICRDHEGIMKWGFVDKVKSLSAFMTEALALKRALLLAIDISTDIIMFEIDCLSLVTCMLKSQPALGKWTSRGFLKTLLS